MKKTYVAALTAAILTCGGLASCSSETTTGVDTETSASEVDGELNGMGTETGTGTNENVSPLDTAENQAMPPSGAPSSTTTPPIDSEE